MKTLILVPTYNEADNIEPLLRVLRASVPAADVLVLDDSSPDGTGTIVAKLAKHDRAVHLMERKGKEGLGKAYVAGFTWALEHPYDTIVSMDADFSHDPKDLPRLLAASDDRTVVIGSRYVPGGKIEGWGVDRYILSATANLVTRTALGLKPKDSSAGFKVYPRAFLESLNLQHVLAAGYAFQVEMLLRAQEAGFNIREVPITFVDRRAGQSKIAGEAKRSIKIILQLASQREGIRQFVRFGVVGVSSLIVDWGIYFLIERLTGLPKPAAKALSFLAAAINSYYFNRRWTFKSQNREVHIEFAKFFAVSGIGALLNIGIFSLLVLTIHLPDIVGLAVATALVMFWNFFANKHWTFRRPDGAEEPRIKSQESSKPIRFEVKQKTARKSL